MNDRSRVVRRAPAALAVALAATVALPGLAAAGDPQPRITIPSIKSLDAAENRVVFPLHRGEADGTTVWYILTDASDQAAATARGLEFAPSIAGVGITQSVSASDGTWHFEGAPDFSKQRVFKAGPTGFPPADAAPGAVAIRRRVAGAAERALAHQRHQVVARKNHGERIAVGRRQVGEIFDIAAHLVAVILHQQHIDLFALHGGAHRGPAPLEFGGGDRRLQAFRELFHFSCP